MGTISTTDLQDGNVLNAADVNTPINTIVDEINGNLDQNNLADDAVTTAKINDSAVTTAKLADDAVTPAKWTNPYVFRAHRTANQTGIADATATKVVFNVEAFDTNGDYDATTNNRYDVSVDGVYEFGGYVSQDSGGNTTQNLQLFIYVNGSEDTKIGKVTVEAGTFFNGQDVSGSGLVSLEAGDYVELYVNGNTNGGNFNLTGGASLCYFWGKLVHRT